MFVAFSRVCSSTVVVGALGPSSSSGIPYQCMRCSFIVPVLRLLFYTVALLSLQIAAPDISFPFPPALTAGFLVQGLFLFICFIYSFIYLCFPPLSHLALVWQVLRGGLEQGTCSWIAGWVGQSGVLAPWGVTVVAALEPLGHLASICDVGVNLILSYSFIYLEYLYRLAQFGF